jgi:signal transduction histidine kinase
VRLGVSSKIFLAYGVLVVAFAASTIQAVVSAQAARDENQVDFNRRELQRLVERAESNVQQFSESAAAPVPGPAVRIGYQMGLTFARDHLEQAQAAVEKYLTSDDGNPPARDEFQSYRIQLADVEGKLDATVRSTPGGAPGEDGFESRLATLRVGFTKLKDRLREKGQAMTRAREHGDRRSRKSALMLGAAGLLAALLAGLFMHRTLRPLQVLRIHAREIAGGDYGRRIEVPSRDEIGELAREFDAMGRAVQERERRLIRSERLATVGRMAAQITHEVRNPLASLGLYAELLADELRADDEEAQRLVGAIGKELDRLSDITETYLRLVRLPKPKLEREDLGAMTSAVLEFARAELSMAGITLELVIAPGLPDVAADENQVRQALLNLVRNAKEAMPSGGKLRVEVGPGSPGQVRLAIADSGPGIAAEDVGKIFDPFFSTKEKGTGLGLSVVQQIVTEHGGRVEVTTPPQGGTVFVLSFPSLPADASINAASEKTPSPVPVTASSESGLLETAPAYSTKVH